MLLVPMEGTRPARNVLAGAGRTTNPASRGWLAAVWLVACDAVLLLPMIVAVSAAASSRPDLPCDMNGARGSATEPGGSL